jgi:flagellar FliL protein
MADVPVLAPAEDPAPGKGKWVTVVIAVVLVVTGAGVGTWFSQFWVHPTTSTKGQPAKHDPLGPPLYVALDPPFVVNFEAEQLVRFLQVTVQVMSRDPATIEVLRSNDPVVRNDLLMLFGNQKYTIIATRTGKEQLRTDALAAVRKVIAGAGGKPDRIEAIYFTSFVMQ